MPHSHVSCIMHIIFHTKGSESWIRDDIQKELFAYINGIARNHKMQILAIGGVEDHIHIHAMIPSSISLANAVQYIIGSSSRWIAKRYPDLSFFAWQRGFGAFSIGVSQVPQTIQYFQNQKEHHKTQTFEEEMIGILKKHKMDILDFKRSLEQK